jgi:NitT/TauT family transport system permease protein
MIDNINNRMEVSIPAASIWSTVLTGADVQRATGVASVLVFWQAASTVGLNSYYVSSPLAVAGEIVQWVETGYIWPHLLATVSNMLAGFVLAAVIATLFALLVASSTLLGRVFSPLVFVAYSTPKVVLAPLLILWVGIGRPPVIILGFIASFFVVFFNVYSGVRNVPQAYINSAAILGASAWTTAFKFRLPAAAPFVLSGLHQGLLYAFHGVILGEMTASDTGIGYVIIYSATAMDSTGVIAGLAVIGAISYVLARLLKGGLERSVAPAIDAGPVA